MQPYKDLVVWQKAIHFTRQIYTFTSTLPIEERFGLTQQMRRAAVSISANIAEGQRRGSKKDFVRFLYFAFGSGAELETYLVLVQDLKFKTTLEIEPLNTSLQEIMRMLNRLIATLRV